MCGEETRGEEEQRGEVRRGEGRSGAVELIKAKGDNKFFDVDGTLHVGVKADFKENATRCGQTRKDRCVFL